MGYIPEDIVQQSVRIGSDWIGLDRAESGLIDVHALRYSDSCTVNQATIDTYDQTAIIVYMLQLERLGQAKARQSNTMRCIDALIPNRALSVAILIQIGMRGGRNRGSRGMKKQEPRRASEVVRFHAKTQKVPSQS